MLVDARNALYRAIYAGLSDGQFEYDYAVIFFRFLSYYLNRFRASSVHLFWDAPKETLWRKKLYPDYKEGRISKHPEIDQILMRDTEICHAIARAISCRNYELPKQEADDLIYSFCRLRRGDRIIIISSDGDFKQIPYLFNNVDLFNPLHKSREIYPVEELDPVELKAFTGEQGDNIRGYHKVGPVRAKQLVQEDKRRTEFFKVHGLETYLLNRILVDLSLCPYLLGNLCYVDEIFRTEVHYDEKEIRDIIQKYKIRGLAGEISRTLLQFKALC